MMRPNRLGVLKNYLPKLLENKNQNMNAKDYSRRNFIRRLVGGGAAITGAGIFIQGCQGDNNSSTKTDSGSAPVSADPCSDFSGVSAAELEKRKKFGYVDKTPEEGKACHNCGLFIPWEKEKTCGGCLLFKGPVHTDGYCMQWAAKAQPA